MNIGAAIRKVRLEKGLTLEAVALESGTYAGNLSKIERSQQLPSLDLLHKLSHALGTKTSELYAVAESELDGGSEGVSEASSDQGNEVILVRRHFLALSRKNRKLTIEFLKLLGQSQDEA
ncbi:helix-turn-helix transcriptional regulator [Pseudomonas syringae]|nr:helix-turn-helix transcriptional regulator [Pseudomonas syringae]MBD8802399.1 helix-turn-helix transcriptional regulator [Pseudomonas syringae]MBD8813107.1 helix-turn-helix transcriptional regulator [Pseudomonas syringae]